MSKLFYLLLLTALFTLPSVRADDGADLDRRKNEILSGITKQIQKLENHKACISAAHSQDELRNCREEMQEERKAARMGHLQKRKARIEERIQKTQEQK